MKPYRRPSESRPLTTYTSCPRSSFFSDIPTSTSISTCPDVSPPSSSSLPSPPQSSHPSILFTEPHSKRPIAHHPSFTPIDSPAHSPVPSPITDQLITISPHRPPPHIHLLTVLLRNSIHPLPNNEIQRLPRLVLGINESGVRRWCHPIGCMWGGAIASQRDTYHWSVPCALSVGDADAAVGVEGLRF